jgi:hypothetical protein
MVLKVLAVSLPNEVIERCKKHGQAIVDAYLRGDNPRSRSVSSHGADTDPHLQAEAKAAECAACLWAGLSIDQLNWSNHADAGFDIVLCKRKIDIKANGFNDHYLIWPVRKTELFEDKDFDAFLLVKSNLNANRFHIHKWISKKAFRRDHQVAMGGGLTPGTWCVHETNMHEIVELLDRLQFDLMPPRLQAVKAILHRTQFEYISSPSRAATVLP